MYSVVSTCPDTIFLSLQDIELSKSLLQALSQGLCCFVQVHAGEHGDPLFPGSHQRAGCGRPAPLPALCHRIAPPAPGRHRLPAAQVPGPHLRMCFLQPKALPCAMGFVPPLPGDLCRGCRCAVNAEIDVPWPTGACSRILCSHAAIHKNLGFLSVHACLA